MAMFDAELLKRFEYLSLVAHRADRRSPSGGGTEVAGLRDYAPGDDFRHVDWVACARRDELLTKVFAGDEDRHVYILLDCSLSMGLGRPAKFELARQIAAVVGYEALTSLDCVNVLAFAGGVVVRHGPIRHRGHFPGLLRFLGELPLHDTRTDLARTAQQFAGGYQRHGPAVVISDLYDPDGFERAFDVLQYRGYEPRLVQIHEPGEIDPGLPGDLDLVDVEAGSSQRVTVTERAAGRYRVLMAEFRESVCRYCAKHGITHVQVASNAPEDEVLLKVLRAKRTGSIVHASSGRQR